MLSRIKYPLTQEAKESAMELSKAWDEGRISQYFELTDVTAGNVTQRSFIIGFGGIDPNLSTPPFGILRELSTYGLIRIIERDCEGVRISYEILLLQELRNAVENDFEVSDYFLTLNTVGTIVQGDLTLQGEAIYQSSASIYGNIEQRSEQIADELESILSESLINNQALQESITNLRQADKSTFPQKLGNVVTQLGNSLGHGANTVAVIQAIATISQFIS